MPQSEPPMGPMGVPPPADSPETPELAPTAAAGPSSTEAPSEAGEAGAGPVDGEGLTVRAAAAALGITTKAVQGRIDRGTLEAWKVETKYGEQWRVRLPAEAPGHASPGDTPTGPTSEGGQGTHADTPMGGGEGGSASAAATGEGTPMEPPWEAERARLVESVSRLEREAEGLRADKAWLQGRMEERDRQVSELARLLEQEQHARASLEARQARALSAPIVPIAQDLPRSQDPAEEPAQGMDGTMSIGEGAVSVEPERRRPWWRFW